MLIELTSRQDGAVVLVDPYAVISVSPTGDGGSWLRIRDEHSNGSSGGPEVKESGEEVRDMIAKAGIEIRGRGKK